MNERVLKMVVAVCAVAALCATAADATPKLVLQPLITFIGDTPTLKLDLQNGDEPYAGVNAKVMLPNDVGLVSAVPGGIFPSGFEVDAYEYTDGPDRILALIVYSGGGATTAGSGTLLDVQLSIGNAAGVGVSYFPFIGGVSGISNVNGSASIEHTTKKGTIQIDAVATPVIQVDPATILVGRKKGQTVFTVTNVGSGTLDWSAAFSGAAPNWASFNGPQAAIGNGTFTVRRKKSNLSTTRTATILVSDPAASNSPVEVIFRQRGYAGSKSGEADIADSNLQAVSIQDGVSGAPSKSNIVQDISTFAPIVPVLGSAGEPARAFVNSPLYVRLRSDQGIDAATVWGVVNANGLQSDEVTFQPIGGSATDGWAVYMPQQSWKAGDTITMSVGASTPTGEAIALQAVEFRVESFAELVARTVSEQSASPIGNNLIPVSVVSTGAAQIPALGGGIGPVYQVGGMAYPTPQQVWLPVPDGVSAGEVDIYYYQSHGAHPGWYPANQVDAWLLPDSIQYVNGAAGQFIGFDVNHAAVVQLGLSATE